MTFNKLLAKLTEHAIELRRDADGLLIHCDGDLTDGALLEALREHKEALLALIGDEADWWRPEPVITPDMLSLVTLGEAEIARLVRGLPGRAGNVQDIYPLAPLQQGMLFHHLMAEDGDPYLLNTLFAFDSRDRLDAFVEALQKVIARHDILRTSVHWEGLGEPVQVVLRRAPLAVEEVDLDPRDGPIEAQLEARFDARAMRLDLTRAPLLRAIVAHDAAGSRWIMHVLFHHLVMDHTALAGVEREVQAILAGRESELPEPVPFRNYVAQARLGVSQEEHEAFFRAMLGDVDEPTLPFGLRDVRGDGRDIAEAHLPVGAGLARRVRVEARRAGVSAASLFHVAWALVVGRAAGRDDVVFGTVLFGRMQGGARVEQALGMFINTLPVRIGLAVPVREAVVETHHRLTQLLRHEHAPLALAQQASGVEAPAPLFSALLNYRHGQQPKAGDASPALAGVESLLSEERTNYPLSLAVDDMGEGFALTVQVVAGLEGARICGYVHEALEGVVAALEQASPRAVYALPILPAAEREELLCAENRADAADPGDACLHALFEAQAARTPERIALVHEGRHLTYAALNARANQLAHHLIGRGIGPERRVAICASRGMDMVIGLLGILKAGGAYVPLDPAYPAERLRHILRDADPALVLVDVAGYEALGGEAAVADALFLDAPAWDDAPDTNPEPRARPANLAYAIYTSGSTGTPKGVEITHAALVNLLASMADRPGIDPGDTVLNLTSLSFDIAALELYLPLLHGARLVLASRDAAIDPARLAALIETEAVTFVQATPAHWTALLDHGWPARSFKVLCGGEALPAALAARLHAHVPVIWNMYGPTETTIWSAVHAMERGMEPAIGAPVSATALYVLDAQLEPVPVGVPGELYIAGAGLARGYCGRSALTAERFLPDPFSARGERMYHTGDRVRRRADGTLEFLGRADSQIKIRGFRIEPAEIETALGVHPRVRHALVAAHADPSGQKHLIAYVEPRADDSQPADTLSFSLFYFGAETYDPKDKYRLYLESAEFADRHGFEAVWTPERHFHTVGALYPNPAVLNAALAARTSRVHLRAGSVVLPLHPVQRVAEEWAVVDNLSQGRVGMAIASGWHSRDFSLAPQNYPPAKRKEVVRQGIETLKALWAGETVVFPDGQGQPVEIQVYPRPVQSELPLWLTAAGNPDTFAHAGRTGTNLLTHLLGQTMEELTERVALYRRALAEHGHDPRAHRVTLMVHAYLGDDLDTTLGEARIPFMNYMREHVGLLRPMVQALVPAEFASPRDIDQFIEQHLDQLVEFAFERYARTAALIGTPASCLPMLEKFRECGVDEIACLIDWMEPDLALRGLPALDRLRERARSAMPSVRALRDHCRERLPDYMVPGQIVLVDRWPLTPNGKIDRKALPAPDLSAVVRREYEAPQGAAEEQVARIWAEVLGQPQVGRHDNFFELGGHSLLAINVIERMRQAGLHTDVRALFNAPTLAALAAQVGTEATAISVPAGGIEAGSEAITPAMLPLAALTQDEIDRVVAQVPGGAANIQDIYPLAPLQEGVLFHHLMSREGDPFVLNALFGIETRARLDAFLGALGLVIARHDILRTSVHWEGLGEPVQAVWRDAPLTVEEVELDPEGDAPADQLRALYDERRVRLDVRRAPLLRVIVARDAGEDRWLMLVLFHHLAMDHTALERVAQEVQAHVAGEQAGLPAPVPFRNYVAQSRLGVTREEHQAFFRDMLAGVEEPTLPFALLDVQGEGRGIGEARLFIDDALARRVRAQARQLGVSSASLFHLAWAQVLGEASGRDDVVFGTVLFGRMAGGDGAERALGMFINTLPVRIGLTKSVRESVALTHRALTQLLRHEHAPLAIAQQASGVAASVPLFSALLNYRYTAPPAERDGIELLVSGERTNYPLAMTVDDFGDAFMLTAQVVERLEPTRICGYLHEALAQLVSALERRPQAAPRELPILPAAERRELTEEWNATQAVYPGAATLHARIEAQAARTPDAPALFFEGETLTYAEVNRRANRLAHRLIAEGVRPDDRVALCMERSVEMVVGLLGILKAGAAYAPLDPTYPPQRLAYMLADSAPAMLLTQRRWLDMLRAAAPEGLPATLCLDAPAEAGASPYANPDVPLTPAHTAYVIYTSGSTGQPKGVMVPHAGIVNRLDWMQQTYRLEPGESVLQKTPFGFDVSVWEFFWPLMTGARLVLCRPEGHKDPEYLAALIEREGIGTAHFVPSMLQVFAGFLEGEPAARCASLARVICSGEALPGGVARRLRVCLPHAGLHNLYGPTEASVDVTAWACDLADLPDNIPIGRPVANTRIYILNGAGEPVPAGVAGELFIGGVQLARGYLNRAALTAERFLPDPFGLPGGRMYRTGDVARYRLDGAIEYLGRNDDQVKIRGFRIELGEVGAALEACAGVSEALAVAPEEAGERRLVGYYTGEQQAAETLRAQLAARLPEYMVPSACVWLPAWPVTANGKLDRRALPRPERDAYAAHAFEAPREGAEQQIAQIWQEVLGQSEVGRHDNFFELGGHSLLAISAVERMRQAGLHADVRTLFEAPTLAGLAAEVGRGAAGIVVRPNAIPAGAVAITPDMLPLAALAQDDIDRILAEVPGGAANVQDIYPLAPLQEGVLFHHLLATEGDPYVLDTLFGIETRARLDAFLGALRQVIARHDILRTSVHWQGLAEPVQVVWREAPLVVEEAELDPAAGDPAAQLRARFDARRTRLDVRAAPMLRVIVARDAGDDRWLMLVLFHHLAIDHMALDAVAREVQALLAGAAELPEPAAFRDYVAQARLGIARAEHERFFAETLGDVDEPTLPFGLQDVQGEGRDISETRREVGADLAARIRRHARELGVSAASLFHLAFAQVVGRASGRDDVVFGTVLFGRMAGAMGTGNALGLFINTLPVRIGLRPGVRDAARRTHRALTRLMRHEHAPLALAQQASGVKAPAPLFSALLNYRYDETAQSTDAGWEGVRALDVQERTNYPLMLAVDDRRESGGFGLAVQVSDAIGGARIACYVEQVLRGLCDALEEAPSRAVHALEMLPAAEREEVLHGWNRTAADYPRGVCFPALFEAQAARTPDAVALEFEDRTRTYAELNARANQLAHHLIAGGVAPDQLVAICAERGPEMVVALIGIMKAGAAYVPLDPAYPVERLAYVLADAQPAFVLADAVGAKALGGEAAARALRLDAPSWGDQPVANPGPRALPAHAAYVIYTSGSTGRPKGVAVPHAALVNFLTAMAVQPGIHAGDAVLSLTSLSFDIAALELYLPLLHGARLVLASREEATDAERLARLIETRGVSLVQATPSHWRLLVDHRWPDTSFKLLCGGEALPEQLAARLLANVPVIWNMYGPTETTIWSAVHAVREPRDVAIGLPIANTALYVLDARLEPVPAGVPGELYIAGDGLARGYLRRPDLTAERFLPDPFGAPGSRMYRTGDVVRRRAAGALEFIGRADSQVKIRGFRIEPAEIETVLGGHPQVRQAAVTVRRDQAGQPHLVGYVETRGDAARGADTLAFSLFYFGADTYDPDDKYRLYLESAVFADRHGFEAVWTPERHFHTVGGLYPNPALLNAALAMRTTRVQLRAGSVVLPLHQVQRVAEEWAAVDNLSRGRAGVAIASGWHVRDFSLAPHHYAPGRRKDAVREGIAQLKALWAGEAVSFPDGNGDPVDIRVFPRPVQRELPLWLTAAGHPDTFAHAGRIGANLLTHLLGQSIEELAEKVALYRRSLAEAGHDPRTRRVTLMVHAYLGDELEATLAEARAPFKNYMREHLGLLRPLAESMMPADMAERASPREIDGFLAQHVDQLTDFAFERYARTAALIGTPASCLPILRQIVDCGVDEVACLIDWIEPDKALAGLSRLDHLRVAAHAMAPGMQTLRRYCQQHLPDYMVPGHLIPIDRWPLTPNGKIDRNALPSPDFGLAAATRAYEGPQGAAEQQLAAIWGEVLGVERVGRFDHFFDLGGHSLSAMQLISQIRRKLGIEVELAAVFRHPLLHEQAEALGAAMRSTLPGILAVPRDVALPLSFAQQRLWFLAQIDGGSAAYHTLVALRLRGALDRPALRRALDLVLARHEGLRTTFEPGEDGQPVQCIAAPDCGFALTEHDLSGDADPEAALEALRQEEAHVPFDLAAGPLIRGRLARLSPEDHVLLVNMHHIVSDGWSIAVLTRDLGAVYDACRRGADAALPALPIQYADYAVWQRRWLSGQVMQAQADYWRDALAGAPPLLELPMDRARPLQQDFSGATIPVEFDETLTAGLKALGQRHGTTLYMTLLAAWAVVLAKLSGQDEVVVGSPVANRTRAEVEGLIGFFTNTLALRVEVPGYATVADLLAAVKARTLAAQAHQDLPFEQVVEIVKPARSLAHSPIFQAMFAWQNNVRAQLDLAGLRLEVLDEVHRSAKFDLTLELSEVSGRIRGLVEYATALFDRATPERYVGYLRRVLEAMVRDDAVALRGLTLADDAERGRVLEEWNRTSVGYPAATLEALFEAQADRTPDVVAVAAGAASLTYAELDARANRVAHALIARGVGPEARVAICMRRGLDMVAGLLGVLKAGAAYVPLDPAYPAERLAFMLGDCQPAALLTQSALRDALPVHGIPTLSLDGDRAVLDEQSSTRPERRATADHLAYVIYTSGSTGQPKGVMVTHGGLSNYLHWAVDAYGAAARNGAVVSSSLSFDATVTSLWLPLLSGGHVTLLDEGDEIAGLDAYVRREGGLVKITPAHLDALGRRLQGENAAVRTDAFVIGGEALSPATVALWQTLHPGARLINEYGPTETVVGCIVHDAGGLPAGAADVPVGRPIANARIYLLDAGGAPVPVGVTGEIYIAGAGVARGYLGRPGLTAERFLPDPFGEPGSRMYRTGDLARHLPDGTIVYLGRNDEQVKLRGFRIEPGEIVAALLRHDGVRDAVVILRADSGGERRLVAYYTGDAGGEALREHLRAGLPDYMVPAAFVRMDALPLTANGKLDRRALPEPGAAPAVGRDYVPPEGEVETRLAQIWRDVLKVDSVGRHDNFFELGGHSLLAITVIERMRQAGLHADLRALFGAGTLAALASSVTGQSRAIAVPPNGIPPRATAITPDMLPLVRLTPEDIAAIVAEVPGGVPNVQDIYPLAPLQEGVLFHHLLATDGDPYVLSAGFGFDSRERLDAFVDALRQVIARHDVLRTAVHWEGLPQPVQVVWRDAPLAVEEIALDPLAGDAAAQLRARFDARRLRIDVSRAPMLRVAIARAEAGCWAMQVLFHHLAMDHMALEIVQDEIRAILSGEAARLPAPAPFRDYVAQTRLGVPREEHEAFFRAMLGDVDEPTLPFGLGEARGDGQGIAEAALPVDDGLARRLRAQARRLGVSAASLFHLAFAQVVARASGRDDVVFGTVLFGRLQGADGAARTLGMVINTLPVRIGLGVGAGEAALRTHRLLTQLIWHEHAPLALAQQASGVAAPAPLFSALMNYRYSAAGETGAGDAWAGIEMLEAQERTNYPLVLSVDDQGEGFRLTVKVAGGPEPARIGAYVHEALGQLADALERTPERRVSDLPILPAAELRRLTGGVTQADPADTTLHALIEAQAARTPDAVALIHEDAALTYAELNRRANLLARLLIARGVRPDARVAICMERGFDMMVGLLAILKAGAGYVPLDPGYPAERLATMLGDSAPLALLTHAPTAPVARALRARPIADVPEIDVGAFLTRVGGRDAVNPQVAGLSPGHLAYMIYTSGSTGRPKGVMVEHRQLVGYLRRMQELFPLGAEDAVAQKTPLSFDPSVWELFAPLLAGGRLILARTDGHRDPAYLTGLLREAQVHTVRVVPTLLAALVETGGLPECTALRRVFCGGEALPRDLIERFQAQNPDVMLANMYGPTETTINVTSHVYAPGASTMGAIIGRPLAGTGVYVLDGALNPVPPGATAELYVAGDGLARGYLNRPDLTAAAFIPDPFSPIPGARMYRTGDLARLLPDRTLHYAGRADHQVKLRGFRIEPGEVEAQLTRAGVRDAVVILREDAPGQPRLVAYHTALDIDAGTLRARLAESLPEHMVPSTFVALEALPLTPNGKLDRRALPEPDVAASSTGDYEAPRGETEQAIAAIWSGILGVERIGRRDNFFALGGHSLLATRMVAQIRRVFAIELPLRAVFEAPTLAGIAERLATHGDTAPRTPPLVPATRPEPLPLSFAQQRLWFLDQMLPDKTLYHVPIALRATGPLDIDALGAALGVIVQRHEVLRTRYVVTAGQPGQHIDAAADIAVPLFDLSALPPHAREAEAMRLARAEAARPFDLAAGLPIRCAAIRLGAAEHVIVLTVHHIAFDGWSAGVLARELSEVYAARIEDRPARLPALPVHYADFALWQRDWLKGEVLDAKLAYWRQQLAGVPALLELPTDRPRPAMQSLRGASHAFTVPEAVATGLRAVSRRVRGTLFMTLHAAFAALLSRYSGQSDVCIGTPVANRGEAGIEPLIGFFVNTLVLRLDVRRRESFLSLLRRAQDTALDAYAHQDVPFEHLVEVLNPQRDLSHTPLFQAMLVLQNAPAAALALPGLETAPFALGGVTAKYDLTLTVHEEDGRLACALDYCADLFDASTIQRMSRHLLRLLAEVAENPERSLADIPVMDEEERHRILHAWNDTAAPAHHDTIPALFDEQVARAPQATAVEFADEKLTYAELDARANRLAHALCAHGVGPDVPVALCIRRSLDMVVAVLGILKAGGAYVPLDPDYPLERIDLMLRDAAPRVLIAERGLLDGLPPHLPVLHPDSPAIDACPAHAPDSATTGGNLAYIVYTSGSTGMPKGVAVTHGNVVRLVHNSGYFDAGARPRVLQFASLNFDATTFEMWAPLLNGGTVVVAAPERHSIEELAETIASGRIDTLWLTATVFNQMVERRPQAFASLRHVLTGGEALSLPHVRQFLEAGYTARLTNGYGPTESTTFACCHDITPATLAAQSVPIGRPIANTSVYILDADFEPVPVGIAGELYIGGQGLARGYLGRPDLTAERFLPNPFAADGSRLYRTGDLARFLPAGPIEYLGRTDTQIKIRGFRIEAGEIEAALLAAPGIGEALVTAIETPGGERQLAAYVVARPGAGEDEIDPTGLRAFLKRRLPDYMIPAHVVALERLPVTLNGKVDKAALPMPDMMRGETGYVSPSTPMEALLADIWARVLRRDKVGVHDNFFDLGGHSLSATQVVSEIREEVRMDLPLRAFFEHPTIAAIAPAIEALIVEHIEGLSEEDAAGLLAQGEEERAGV